MKKINMVSAEAPSNIALIKYMGKVSAGTSNFPANASLSITLPHLRTRVEVREFDEGQDDWKPLKLDGWNTLELSSAGKKRYLKHWNFLKQELDIKENFLIQSANNFPSDCGLASSASSFAALTMAARNLAVESGNHGLSDQDWANLSRQGSGSSCRSFFGPLVYWEKDEIYPFELNYDDWIHQVVVVDSDKKKISSSEAHQKVASSLLNIGRSERAKIRIDQFKEHLSNKNWSGLFEVVWAEFWDMHALFETSQPSFGYMTSKSLTVLKDIHSYWRKEGDGPLVTMDAGANIHLLYRQDQASLAKSWMTKWQGVSVYA